MNKDVRRIIFPIDGAFDSRSVLAQSTDFFSNEDVRSRVGMLKLNDGLHMPGAGPDILERLRSSGTVPEDVAFFIDLKIVDVKSTVANTLKRYALHNPQIVTVFSGVAAHTLDVVRTTLPNTKIALVDTLTDISYDECFARYNMSPADKISQAIDGFDIVFGDDVPPIDLIVCSVNDVDILRRRYGDQFGFVCPGIRDAWMLEKGNKDHQERISGIYTALEKGISYVVMGTQLSVGNPEAGISAEESRQRTWAEMGRYFSDIQEEVV